jgi:hypothetical protein
MPRWLLLLPFLVVAFAACEEQETVESPQEICADGGGEWSSDGCMGAEDQCNRVACETAVAEGCHCPEYECWDGTSCVTDTSASPEASPSRPHRPRLTKNGATNAVHAPSDCSAQFSSIQPRCPGISSDCPRQSEIGDRKANRLR